MLKHSTVITVPNAIQVSGRLPYSIAVDHAHREVVISCVYVHHLGAILQHHTTQVAGLLPYSVVVHHAHCQPYNTTPHRSLACCPTALL